MMVDVRDELEELWPAELGDGALYRHCDVRDEQDWATAVSTAESAFGGLDVLVNNAAVLRLGLLEEFDLEDFKALIEVNEIGVFLGMKAVIPGDAQGWSGLDHQCWFDGWLARHRLGVCGYAATKWALEGYDQIRRPRARTAQHPGQRGRIPAASAPRCQETLFRLRTSEPERRSRLNGCVFAGRCSATPSSGRSPMSSFSSPRTRRGRIRQVRISRAMGGATIGPRYVNV